jgi:hypothetical protein
MIYVHINNPCIRQTSGQIYSIYKSLITMDTNIISGTDKLIKTFIIDFRIAVGLPREKTVIKELQQSVMNAESIIIHMCIEMSNTLH